MFLAHITWIKENVISVCSISGSDFPTSRQLVTEADSTNHTSLNEISQPPSAKGEPTQ